MTSPPLLEVAGLKVSFRTDDGVVDAVSGISYRLSAGEVLGIVGESGSGKSVGALTLLGLTLSGRADISGTARFEGRDLIAMDDDELRRVRGGDVAMIFQDPLSSLHPYYRVGAQIAEAITAHGEESKRAARARAIELLSLVGIPDPAARVDAYPHEFSGGMRQRAMIAMALANQPKVLIADEPTTALDVTVQAQILELLDRLRRELNMAMIIITHDLGVVAQTADRIAVMYAGRIVEEATAKDLFTSPRHPYTWGLLQSVPRIDAGTQNRLLPIPGRPPSLINLPDQCAFAPRCGFAHGKCRAGVPALADAGTGGHLAACVIDEPARTRAWEALSSGADPNAARMAAEVEG